MADRKSRPQRIIYDRGVLEPGWQMVGRYMYYFGQLELALGDIVRVLLSLSDDAARLLFPHLYFMAKINIIVEAIPFQKEQDDNWKRKATRIVNKCRGFNDDRNMFCHGAFS